MSLAVTDARSVVGVSPSADEDYRGRSRRSSLDWNAPRSELQGGVMASCML